MKHTFQLLSDLHLEMGTYFTLKAKASYLLLAGDIGYPETQIFKDFMKQCSKKFEKVFYISGNHEYYQSNNNTRSIKQIEDIIKEVCHNYDNVFYLQNDYYDLDYIRIVGSTLWSEINEKESLTYDFSNIYNENNKLVTTSDIINIHNSSKEYIQTIIETSDKPLLIITHHLPSYEMILPIYNLSESKSHFASNLEYLFQKPIITWVCGHSHGFNKKIINNIPCIINAIGYPSEPRKGSNLNYTFDYYL